MNEKIQQEAFDQLLIYALLLRERTRSKQAQAQQGSNESESSTAAPPPPPKKRSISVPLRFLRLFYLTSTNNPNEYNSNVASPAVYWDMDLGSTEYERNAILDTVYQDLIMVWVSINDLVTQQNLHNFYGCTRPYCTCHKFRPLFPTGSVWEPPSFVR
jgi:hypothetical protein